ncbi:MAG: tRNA-dihydrouridine synthase [Bacteroidales bacterium]
MATSFWHNFNKPVFTLAPMEDVTDTVFREIVLGISDPECLHVLFSEFMSTHGFVHAIGGPRVKHRIQINPSELELLKKTGVKIVAQIWGTDPEKFAQTASEICNDGHFDGIDINMGCPVRKIVKQGGCSALIGQPELAKEIIIATQEASTIPVSIKTRVGLKKVITEEWISHLLETEPVLITIHGRIQTQQSEGLADWNEVAKAVKLRDRMGSKTLIHGNGDVMSYEEGLNKAAEFGADGIMIGRGIFQDPWFFNKTTIEKTPEERLQLLWKHATLFTETWQDEKSFAILKRFFKIYTSGFHGAANIRAKLMETNSMDELRNVLEECDFSVF